MFDFLSSPCVVLTVFVTELEKRKPVCVCATCSCMDTSSKAWLPHQSHFGLVGQAEVCCGGPGVNLTPSEWADLTPLLPPAPQSVLVPSDRCSLYICFSMSPPPVNASPRPRCQCNKKFAFSQRTPLPSLHHFPFPPVASVSFYRHNEALQNRLNISGLFYCSPLSPAAERRSPSEPGFVTLAEFHLDVPRVLMAPFAFHSSFDTLLTPPAPTLCPPPLPRRTPFLFVSSLWGRVREMISVS